MVKIWGDIFLPVLLAAALWGFVPVPVVAEVKSSFLYNLSDFNGTIPYNSPRLSIDRERNEISVLYQNTIRVFNESGMEIYRFGDDVDLGHIVDLSTDKDGNVLLLAYRLKNSGDAFQFEIVRCNFRGELTGKMAIRGLPAQYSEFSPNRMVYHSGKLYFADLNRMKILITDVEGNFTRGYDLFSLLDIKEKEGSNTEVGGFNVDEDGSILFTIPVRFTAYKLSPDGGIVSFGKPGGAPGKFNIVTGITMDKAGNYLVVDRLKCTVMVFDKNFNYLTQFGYRGFKRGNLIAPDDIATDSVGRVYVTQNGRRGVSVYKITY